MHSIPRVLQPPQLHTNTILQIVEIGRSFKIILKLPMNLPKQIYLYQIQLVVHFLLLITHLLGVSELEICVESMEVAKV